MVMKKETRKASKLCKHSFHFIRIFDNSFHLAFVKDANGKEIHENHIASFICDKCGFHKSIGVIHEEE